MVYAREKWQARPFLWSLALISAAFWALWAYLRFLGFQFFVSDVQDYWRNSLDWRHPFILYHVPGYPLLIAALRGGTFNIVPPLVIMRSVTFLALLGSAALVYALLRQGGLAARPAAVGMLLFAFWPFAGLVFTVYPTADALAMFVFLGGLYMLVQSRMAFAGILFGLSLLIQKALWLFVGLVLLLSVWGAPRRAVGIFLVAAIVPIAIFYLAGTYSHRSAGWIFVPDLRVEVSGRGGLPVLDGLLGTLLQQGVKGFFKTGVVVLVAIVPAATLVWGTSLQTDESRLTLAIALSILGLALLLNQFVIWSVVRFSKLLVVPLLWRLQRVRPALLDPTRPWAIALSASVASQFAYAWYMARVFYQ